MLENKEDILETEETVEEAAGNEAEEAAMTTEETGADISQDEEQPQEDGEKEDINAEDDQDGDGAAGSAKKSFFKKKKDKRDEQIEELNDKLKRQMAEFDNFRKRTDKEKSQMYDMGAKTIIEKMLPVVDNFERGLAAVPDQQKEDAFVMGMDKIYKQLMTELEAIPL